MPPRWSGVDAISFAGGIGENSALVRRRVLEGLEFLGVSLDLEKNEAAKPDCELTGSISHARAHLRHRHQRGDYRCQKGKGLSKEFARITGKCADNHARNTFHRFFTILQKRPNLQTLLVYCTEK